MLIDIDICVVVWVNREYRYLQPSLQESLQELLTLLKRHVCLEDTPVPETRWAVTKLGFREWLERGGTPEDRPVFTDDPSITGMLDALIRVGRSQGYDIDLIALAMADEVEPEGWN